jgi:hypothetical protein
VEGCGGIANSRSRPEYIPSIEVERYEFHKRAVPYGHSKDKEVVHK